MADVTSCTTIADGNCAARPAAFFAGDDKTTAAIAAEVIHRVAEQARVMRSTKARATPGQIEDLACALLNPKDDMAASLVRDSRLRGLSPDDLYHGLVAGAVKIIGNAWARDEIVLTDVVRASTRIWGILRDLREAFVRVTDQVPGQNAIFALCPDECHTIGMTMTADDLRRRGWNIEILIGYDRDSLVERLEAMAPATVALAGTMSDLVLPLARTVVALRAQLPSVWVMIGGDITRTVPDLLAATGADAVANSADEAEALMLARIVSTAERRANLI